MICGRLETPSLAELRARVAAIKPAAAKPLLREIVANVQDLHADPANAGALFQVASQFNLLEMAGPGITPEMGVGIYENDHTQGPACAIAAGAGTIYRNYFAAVNGQTGQSASNQIDCLADIGEALGNPSNRLWEMRNGYALASRRGLMEISNRLTAANESELDQLRGRLRIGIQWNTQVTFNACQHLVSQVYCSALPCAYSESPLNLWERLVRLILEATYEATLCTAILNAHGTGNRRLFLTLGGGAFGNETACIIQAIERALKSQVSGGLDIAIVSYGRSRQSVHELVGSRSSRILPLANL